MSEIKVSKKGGPIHVKGIDVIDHTTGEVLLENTKTGHLCRCGGSENKPFCDGTHAKNDFNGERIENTQLSKEERIKKYFQTDSTFKVRDDRYICAHIGVCTDDLPKVYNSKAKPWIAPDNATIEENKALTKKCPSSALDYEEAEQKAKAFFDNQIAKIFIYPKGPYFIQGKVELIDDQDSMKILGEVNDRFAMCRCGKSEKKPFCDGTHWYVEFDK